MQIASNTTGMVATLWVASDKEARDHCVVAVKGTFVANSQGALALAEEQRPLIEADEHFGDPASTAVRYECDFAFEKPLTDVIVVGKAVAPPNQRVKHLPVRLEVQSKKKDLMIMGERRWVRLLGSVFPSDPVPFKEMPITFDRAFGGRDESRGPEKVAVELRNPVGQGFHPHRKAADIEGTPVPNVESVAGGVRSPRKVSEPVGYGCIGRSWQPRISLAGTYDAQWRNERAPFLSSDFDCRYFQCAPRDQQFPHFRGGETIRCVNMSESRVANYVIPTLRIPVRFRFRDLDFEAEGTLDTITLEPHLALATLVWRARVPLRKKMTELREVMVGVPRARAVPKGYRSGKPMFRGLGEAIAWLRR